MVIDSTLYQQMLDHVRSAFPEEACGIIAVKDGVATEVFPIANVSESPVIFKMDPQQQLQAMLRIEDQGWDLGAIFHSHPRTRAYPSRTDVELAFYPDALQIIISLADESNPEVQAFRIQGGEVGEQQLQVIPPPAADE